VGSNPATPTEVSDGQPVRPPPVDPPSGGRQARAHGPVRSP